MTRPLEVRPDVIAAPIDDGAVVYDPRAGRIHRLNSTGWLLWQCCDGHATVDDLVEDLVGVFDGPTDDVGASVRDLVASLRAESLLVDSSPTDRTEAAPAGPPDPVPVPAPDRPWPHRLGPYAGLDFGFTVETDVAELAVELDRVLGSLTAAGDAEDEPFTLWRDGDTWRGRVSDHQLTARSASGLIGQLMWNVNRLTVARSGRYLLLHASALAMEGDAVVLPAVMNSGKSTLAAALVGAGYDYLTDEATAIDLDAGRVVPFPKAITLDPGSQLLFPHLDPHPHLAPRGKWQVPPNEIRDGSADSTGVLRHIVFPVHDEGAANTLEPIDSIDAVTDLVANAFNFADHAHELDRIVAVVEQCTTHRLRHDGLAGPVAAIESLYT
ncbi:MAG: PqqD family protein [Acidimicrobiia bacterium]|nr:PqqD family protein [Acidimicrobiia bacterium]